MRNKTAIWFETKIRYDKTMEDGRNKKVTEVYTVEALNFTEAESAITEEMSHYVSGEFDVKAIARAPYKEIFFSDADSDDKWYRAKLAFITIDEKTEKEKRSNVVYLMQAATLDKARQYIKDVMAKTMIDYEVVSISETPIMDVFERE
jgi:putative phage tail component, N-terminal domain protein